LDLFTSIYVAGHIVSPNESFIPDEMTKQARMTAEYWMERAAGFVEKRFATYPSAARATLIAAYTQAAAGDEIAMKLGGVSDAFQDIGRHFEPLDLHFDHLGSLIREGLSGVGAALHGMVSTYDESGESRPPSTSPASPV
jgi:hypothetical protein